MALLAEQLRKAEERLKQLKAKQAKQEAQKRKEAKRKRDRALLSWGRALEHHLKDETDTAKCNETLAFIRLIIDAAFPKEKQPDRQYAMAHVDHLAESLEPLSAEPEAAEKTGPMEPRQPTPIQESNPDDTAQVESTASKWGDVRRGS